MNINWCLITLKLGLPVYFSGKHTNGHVSPALRSQGSGLRPPIIETPISIPLEQGHGANIVHVISVLVSVKRYEVEMI